MSAQVHKETFESPQNWQHYEIAPVANQYQIFKDKIGFEENSYLKIASSNSSSMLVLKKDFKWENSVELSWKWKVQNVFKNGDLTQKSGDDFPIIIMVLFKYDKDNMNTIDELNYKIWKNVLDREPPHSTLRFIWANKKRDKKYFETPHPPPSGRLVVLQQGLAKCDTWIEEKVDVLEEYQNAFGKQAPKEFTIAIISDSDDTKESTLSYLDDLEIICR
jgi:hypothetical protein